MSEPVRKPAPRDILLEASLYNYAWLSGADGSGLRSLWSTEDNRYIELFESTGLTDYAKQLIATNASPVEFAVEINKKARDFMPELANYFTDGDIRLGDISARANLACTLGGPYFKRVARSNLTNNEVLQKFLPVVVSNPIWGVMDYIDEKEGKVVLEKYKDSLYKKFKVGIEQEEGELGGEKKYGAVSITSPLGCTYKISEHLDEKKRVFKCDLELEGIGAIDLFSENELRGQGVFEKLKFSYLLRTLSEDKSPLPTDEKQHLRKLSNSLLTEILELHTRELRQCGKYYPYEKVRALVDKYNYPNPDYVAGLVRDVLVGFNIGALKDIDFADPLVPVQTVAESPKPGLDKNLLLGIAKDQGSERAKEVEKLFSNRSDGPIKIRSLETRSVPKELKGEKIDISGPVFDAVYSIAGRILSTQGEFEKKAIKAVKEVLLGGDFSPAHYLIKFESQEKDLKDLAFHSIQSVLGKEEASPRILELLIKPENLEGLNDDFIAIVRAFYSVYPNLVFKPTLTEGKFTSINEQIVGALLDCVRIYFKIRDSLPSPEDYSFVLEKKYIPKPLFNYLLKKGYTQEETDQIPSGNGALLKEAMVSELKRLQQKKGQANERYSFDDFLELILKATGGNWDLIDEQDFNNMKKLGVFQEVAGGKGITLVQGKPFGLYPELWRKYLTEQLGHQPTGEELEKYKPTQQNLKEFKGGCISLIKVSSLGTEPMAQDVIDHINTFKIRAGPLQPYSSPSIFKPQVAAPPVPEPTLTPQIHETDLMPINSSGLLEDLKRELGEFVENSELKQEEKEKWDFAMKKLNGIDPQEILDKESILNSLRNANVDGRILQVLNDMLYGVD